MSEQTSTAPFVTNANQSNSSLSPAAKKQVKTKRSEGIRYIVWLAHSYSCGYKMRCCLIFLLSKTTDFPSVDQAIKTWTKYNEKDECPPPLHHPPVCFFLFLSRYILLFKVNVWQWDLKPHVLQSERLCGGDKSDVIGPELLINLNILFFFSRSKTLIYSI